MTKSAQDFARELTTIVDASANALAVLNRVLELQQQSILALASEGSVPAPDTAGANSASHHAAAQVSSTAPETNTAPAPGASPEPAAPTASSPEAMLTQAEKAAQALIDHSPEVAIAQLYQASAHAVSLALMNTVTAQQQLTIIAQAVVTRGAANQLSQPGLPAPPPTEKATGTATPGALRNQARSTRTR
ncbi:MAG: RebB family R body protein [Myxococcaceae bacterium]|nr:RebB family R body protein [Myxococcaceae bacterium]